MSVKHTLHGALAVALIAFGFATGATAQEAASTVDQVREQAGQIVSDTMERAGELGRQAQEKAEELGHEAQVRAEEVARSIDESEQAKELTAGLLEPIYQLAEYMAFPAFHWVAFALLLAGVVSFLLQLVLAKLAVLTRMHISFTEIISDAAGLLISLTGLVLATQAAAENSTFTQSPAAVISAAVVGLIFGFVLYLWGQSQELKAVKGKH